MGIYQRLKPAFSILIAFVFFGCTSKTNDYFKITFTDQPNSNNTMAEYIEVSSQGKLVVVSNRFNKNKELYQTQHFVELSQQQSDSLRTFIEKLNFNNISLIPEETQYHLSLMTFDEDRQQLNYFWIKNTDKTFLDLIHYCQQIPTYSKLYDMDGSYYFNTTELCSK